MLAWQRGTDPLLSVFLWLLFFSVLQDFVLKLMHGPTLMDEAETINSNPEIKKAP